MKFISIKNSETIDCGEATCRAETGTLCSRLAVHLNGEDAACLYNPDSGGFTPLRRRNGWILRSDACMKLFIRDYDKR
jgi:hypothetical protein